MNRLQATSRCECQATLSAVLDEHRHVLQGTASRHGAKETAPAHSIGADRENFDIGWLCPFCGRNTMRTFSAGALRTIVVDGPVPPPPAAAT
jgi:hypothetical protein